MCRVPATDGQRDERERGGAGHLHAGANRAGAVLERANTAADGYRSSGAGGMVAWLQCTDLHRRRRPHPAPRRHRRRRRPPADPPCPPAAPSSPARCRAAVAARSADRRRAMAGAAGGVGLWPRVVGRPAGRAGRAGRTCRRARPPAPTTRPLLRCRAADARGGRAGAIQVGAARTWCVSYSGRAGRACAGTAAELAASTVGTASRAAHRGAGAESAAVHWTHWRADDE